MADTDSKGYPRSILVQLPGNKQDAVYLRRHEAYVKALRPYLAYRELFDYPPIVRRLMPMFLGKLPRGYLTRHEAYERSLRAYKKRHGLPRRSKLEGRSNGK